MPYHLYLLKQPLRVLAAACATVATGLAVAQSSPYYIGAAQSFSHESNLLRRSEAALAQAGALTTFSKADTLSSTALLAGLDQGIGRQRLRADLSLRNNRYSENKRFNNQSYNVSTSLDWETVNRLSGTLSGGVSRNLSSFNLTEIGLVQEKNLEDTRRLDLSARLGLVTQYSLLASVGRREVKNTLDEQQLQARNFTQDSGSLGLRWRPSSLLALGVGVRATQGRYPKFRKIGNSFEADRFKRNEIDLTADYQPSGLSALNMRLSTGKTEYDLATQRNFSGVVGSLNWGWQASGKLRVNTSFSRDTGQDSTALFFTSTNTPATADYSRVYDSLRLSADWAATSKITVTAGVAVGQRELGASLPDANNTIRTSSGRERLNSYSLGARWEPTRSTQVGCNLSVDNIKGSGELVEGLIKNDGFSCYGQFMLK